MTAQPTVKARSAWDWLCTVLVVFAALCLAASVPQTFEMVSVAHDEFGTSVLVVVLEVMAFFALLAPLWVPTWAKTFDFIAYTLLTITSIGNFAGGWNYVWSRTDLKPFWLAVRNWQDPIFGLPVATILLVLFLSGLVPAAMKFFTFLAIRRYRENELDRSPDAVADRAIEPILVQILATQKLQERMLSLNSTVHNPLLLTGQAQLGVTRDDVASIVRGLIQGSGEGEQRRPFEVPAEMVPMGAAPDLDVAFQAVAEAQGEFFSPNTHDVEREQDFEEPEERELTLAEIKAKVAAEGWASLTWGEFGKMPASPEKEAERQRRVNSLKETARTFAEDIGLLKPRQGVYDAPEAVTEAQDERYLLGGDFENVEPPQAFTEAQEPVSASGSGSAVTTWTCSGCGKEGSNGAKGKATSWSRDRGLEPALYCADCRKSGKYGK